MSRPKMIRSLAKVMIAAAWTDGAVAHEEINSLKDLLFHLPGMTARDWSELEIYLDAPVEPEERERLVAELQDALASPSDRELAVRALEDLLQADGAVSAEEGTVFDQVRSALEDVDVGIFGQLGRLARGPVRRRTEAASGPNRELDLDDFIRNKIYYRLRRRLKKDDLGLNLPDETLRKLSLAGGLLARVAVVDREVSEPEFEGVTAAIERELGVEHSAAGLVAEVAVSSLRGEYDHYRLTREYFEATDEAERARFLETLFAVAAADGKVSHAEMEEIRTIATVLKLTHQQFIAAKLKIPREQRAY